ncbi:MULTISPECIES: CBS domain-containing protein [Desulfococcus]|jgi:CBS domain-containing protein|uniref:Putative signal transduction protein with CBS domain containing protein n=1 Tax=Desulfococcus multivorans DSM 2059 TaxID=1121405 RepID=S7TR92_DESML|nr:CBS domain-containing protein [Desulfococcus multivorans]AOY60623.1 CBS domain containing protein [Desulfococcus multivorans]AQV02714.1 signal transduction protein [Desulfococcus multivorans]EPR39667.1 putative signal transduction protein with CBS domain containing protein [Desulfococcus multivorans DSM 2059]MDX9818251.1 CBS domain-containing protein [Desulfococcus multivorans]SKA03604.1 CBS domain-containing protein [Desulfococcus multivorans DSM 2059]
MNVTAKDVMTPRFHTLTPEMPISEAVRSFKAATESEGRKIFGMLVTDSIGRMVGMLSMYDILLFIQPKHVHIWGGMDDVDIVGLVDDACRRAGTILVGDIMTTEVISITPDTHLMAVLDIMIKKHIRRIPVIHDNRIVGIVYISDLFYHLVDKMM